MHNFVPIIVNFVHIRVRFQVKNFHSCLYYAPNGSYTYLQTKDFATTILVLVNVFLVASIMGHVGRQLSLLFTLILKRYLHYPYTFLDTPMQKAVCRTCVDWRQNV